MKGRKGSTDEGGVRSPFFIRWPGTIAPGTNGAQIAGAIDLLPTLTTLARSLSAPETSRWTAGRLAARSCGTARDWPDRMIFSHQNGRVSAAQQQYRLDDEGRLFDMMADPGQTRNVAAEHPEVAAEACRRRVDRWRADVFGRQAMVAGRAACSNDAATTGRFPLAIASSRSTVLPARDGVPHGGVRRSAARPELFVLRQLDEAWRTAMTWDVEVNTTGRYEVTIDYTCREADAGSVVERLERTRVLLCVCSSRSIIGAVHPPGPKNAERIPNGSSGRRRTR